MTTFKKITLPVEGMSCAVCAQSIEKVLKAQTGVKNAAVNFAEHSVLIEYNDKESSLFTLKKVVNDNGYSLIIDDTITQEELDMKEYARVNKIKMKFFVALIFSVPVFMLSMFFMHAFTYEHYILLALSIPVMVFSGSDFFINAAKKIKHGETNMDTLVALSTGIAFLFSSFNVFFPALLSKYGIQPHLYFESATVIITFILLGKYLEERSRSKASSVIKNLLQLQPDKVIVLRNEQEIEISIKNVQVNDIVLIRPGAIISVDGKVNKGESYVDESMITGEPLAVNKQEGDRVFAGTINQQGSLYILTEKNGNKTLLSQIIEQVREAQMSKPPIQKLADKIAGIFVPVVLGIAVLTFVLWIILAPSPALAHAILSTITVLVIACPCALGLATPTALITGIGRGAENGILIRKTEGLEIAHKINAIVFDKTGTITKGKPEVTKITWYSNENNQTLINIFYSLEFNSEHPIAQSICKKLSEKNAEKIEVEHFTSITAKGVKATISGKKYFAGNASMMSDFGISTNDLNEQKTGSVIFFANKKQLLAEFIINDEIRESSAQAVSDLQQMGIEVYMLTGDNENTASAVAKETGIKNFKAGMLPTEKYKFIEELQQKGFTVAMTGDGINDATALAKADLGIAMASGSDISVQSADLVLMNSDLTHIVKAINLSRITYKIIKQNLFWAFFYNVISIPVAAGILFPFTGFLLSPMIAGAAMAMSSVSVVTSSLRLKKVKI